VQENIKVFNEHTAIILSHLYDKFPKPSAMELHKLVDGEIIPDEMYVCEKTDFANCAVKWLADEGFIKVSGGNFGVYHQCILTSKGLSALSSVPDSLGGKDTVISKIKAGLASGSTELMKSAVGASVTILANSL
jgi:hypothetical protein